MYMFRPFFQTMHFQWEVLENDKSADSLSGFIVCFDSTGLNMVNPPSDRAERIEWGFWGRSGTELASKSRSFLASGSHAISFSFHHKLQYYSIKNKWQMCTGGNGENTAISYLETMSYVVWDYDSQVARTVSQRGRLHNKKSGRI